jgi:Flp pilus assembly pilin Flp
MTFFEWRELARDVWRRDGGQTMAEYGVVLAVVAMGAVAMFTALSVGISGIVTRIAGYLPT